MPALPTGLLVLAGVGLGVMTPLGSASVAMSGGLAALAAFLPARRGALLRAAAALQWAALLAMAWLLLTDRFDIRYVWLYSGADLPAYLKLANLWGGDEGTTLLLAALCTSLAARTAGRQRGGVDIGALIGAWYGLTAAWLAPFAATPPAWLAESASQGMNAHLMKVWMLLHAPLILTAYALALSLAAPSLRALGAGLSRWPTGALADARRAWLVLTAGIGFGMIWAFEDAAYGLVWHWDPVQTSAFAVWCFLGAHLHGVLRWRIGAPFWRLVPVSALAAAVMTALTMAVTRNEVLASSHRYVGADSWISHLALAAALLLAGVAHGVAGVRASGGGATERERTASGWALRLVQIGFFVAGLLALGYLSAAYVAGLQGQPRPDALKPFLAMLSAWTQSSELAALNTAFNQWDVDGYALARALLVPLVLAGWIGGWYFMRRLSTRLAWLSALLTVSASAVVALQGGALAHAYRGAGVLSQQVVEVLSLLDASLVSGGYLAIGCAAWAWRSMRGARRGALGYVLPMAMIHIGAILVFWGGLISTALNSYSQHEVRLGTPAAASAWHQDRNGYAFRLKEMHLATDPDGGFSRGAKTLRALTDVEVRTPGGEVLSGQTLYRDTREHMGDFSGPVRQICEALDYRYARYASTPGYILHPVIEHRWSSAIQFWLSPAAVLAASEPGAPEAAVTVVIRVFPLSSLLWLGMILVVSGAAWRALLPRPRGT
ncbi:MAG: cytochrome c biogenesis protein CcsA [Rhodocyclaceae bacterium]